MNDERGNEHDDGPRWLQLATSPRLERLASFTLAIALLAWQGFIETTPQPTIVGAAVLVMGYPKFSERLRKRQSS